MAAASTMMKLDNQKNWWKGVCVNHHANGDEYFCPVRALGRRYIHIRQHSTNPKTYHSTYWENGVRHDVTDKDVRKVLKWAATELNYPAEKSVPIAYRHALPAYWRRKCSGPCWVQ